jgi:hypothetical protein
MQREDVCVALDDNGFVLLGDRCAGAMQAVDDLALPKELAFRRVDVLGFDRIVLMQPPRAEPQHPSPRIGQREDEPAGEVVVPTPVDQAGGNELLLRIALSACLDGELIPSRRKPEPKLPTDFLREPALA